MFYKVNTIKGYILENRQNVLTLVNKKDYNEYNICKLYLVQIKC